MSHIKHCLLPLMTFMLFMFESISIKVKYKQLCNNMNSGLSLKRVKIGFSNQVYILQANLEDFIGIIGKFVQHEMQVCFKCLGETRQKQEMSNNVVYLIIVSPNG